MSAYDAWKTTDEVGEKWDAVYEAVSDLKDEEIWEEARKRVPKTYEKALQLLIREVVTSRLEGDE